jgi:hypothetical protein
MIHGLRWEKINKWRLNPFAAQHSSDVLSSLARVRVAAYTKARALRASNVVQGSVLPTAARLSLKTARDRKRSI